MAFPPMQPFAIPATHTVPVFASVAGAAALGRCGGGKMGPRSSGTPMYL
jgi:hypothetical protein